MSVHDRYECIFHLNKNSDVNSDYCPWSLASLHAFSSYCCCGGVTPIYSCTGNCDTNNTEVKCIFPSSEEIIHSLCCTDKTEVFLFDCC